MLIELEFFEGLVNRPGLPIHTPFHLACVCHSRVKQLVVPVSQNRIFSSFFYVARSPCTNCPHTQTAKSPSARLCLRTLATTRYIAIFFCLKRKVCRVSALLGTSSCVVRIEFSAVYRKSLHGLSSYTDGKMFVWVRNCE